MTPIQSDTPEQVPSHSEPFGGPLRERSAAPDDAHEPSFGSRLRAAREARGLDLEACASTLKLPARVLRKLELDQHDGPVRGKGL